MDQVVTPFIGPAKARTDTPIGGHLGLFAQQWEITSSNTWVINTVRFGLSFEFLAPPLSFFIRCPVSGGMTKWGPMESAIQHLLVIQAIQPVPHEQKGRDFIRSQRARGLKAYPGSQETE